jgi:hypothetical protein
MNDWNKIVRMVSIDQLDSWREFLRYSGVRYRIRYRGPHGHCEDTKKANARAFTVYMTK